MERIQKQQAVVALEKELMKTNETQLGEVPETPPPQQKKCKAMTAMDVRGKAPVGEGVQDVMDKGVLPQREPEVERLDLNFPHYIQPRRTDAEERDLPKKVVTTLVMP